MTEHLAVPAEETAATRAPVWRDANRTAEARADALLAEMTLEEKIARLFGVWVGASAEGGDVAPHQHDMEEPVDLDELLPHGLGQLTRPFGTAPVDPALGALSLARTQRRIVAANRFGIPALAHEECLAGFAAWGATAYPVPLAWGASFDPDLVRRMAAAIGRDLRSVGVRPGPRRRTRCPLGPRRGDHRRGPGPRRHHRHGIRAGPRVGRDRRHAQALRRILGLPRGPQSRAGVHGRSGVRRCGAPTVRDGRARERRTVRHARLYRRRRHSVRRRRAAPDRTTP